MDDENGIAISRFINMEMVYINEEYELYYLQL